MAVNGSKISESVKQGLLSRHMAGRLMTGHKHSGVHSPAVRAEMFGEIIALLDSVAGVVIVSDFDGKIVFWNRGAAQKYQWAKEEAIGRPWFSLLKTRAPGSFAVITDELIARGTWEGELTQEKKDGTPVVCAGSAALRTDDAGVPVAIIVIANDIGMSIDCRRAENEKLFHDFAEKLPEGIGIVAGGRIVSINSAGVAIAGISAEKILGREFLDFIPEYRRGVVAKRMSRILTGGRAIMREEKLMRVDGREIDVEFSGVPADFNGTRAIQFIFRDISQRKLLECKKKAEGNWLRENWAGMEQIFDTMPVMMNAVDNQGLIVVWNRECEWVTGYSAREIVGNPRAFKLLFPDSEQRRIFSEKWTGRGGDFRDWECTMHCKDGRQRVISWSNISGSFPRPGWRTWAFGSDITERKIAEERISTAHRQLFDLIEFLPDATFAMNIEKKVIAWNHAMENLTGVNKADIIGRGDHCYSIPFYGKPHLMLIDLLGVGLEEIRLKYGDVKQVNGILYAERFIPLVNKGKGAFLHVKVAPLMDKKGAVIGGIETTRDITEQKTYEAMLKKDKDGFEKLLIQRTQQLLNVQRELSDARHLSEIGTLAATVAHELRNPLAAMRMGAYNIRRRNPSAPVKTHIDIIEKKIRESDQIINNLLNYARIKSPAFEYVKLRELIEDAVASVKARFYDWKVKIELKDGAGGITVHVDSLQVREMVGNILTNAYEALKDKTGTIVIQIKKGRNAFSVSVTDNGVGISADNLRKISRPFFTTKSKGTGLGLAVCRQMSAMHGGKIKFKSVVDKGTIVTLSLPIRRGGG